MNKAILVIDMPDSCRECPFFGSRYTDMCCGGANNRTINYPYPKDFRQDWCPLKPVPEKREDHSFFSMNGYTEDGYSVGWNDCVDEIYKEM